MKRAMVAPMLFIIASHQAIAQDESSKRAYLGVQLQGGALVGNVDDNGPAQLAGIQPGYFIVSFDGKEIKSSDELSQTVAATPSGKDVAITVIRRGKEGTTTAKLGQRLVLSGAPLDEFRQKLAGILQELESLQVPKGTWSQSELQRFSDLFDRFQDLKKTVPPEDTAVQNLWSQLERLFAIYKPSADNARRQREAQRVQETELARNIEEQLGPLYVNYMTLQVCASRFPQFDKMRYQTREFLKNKELGFSREQADELWNAVAVKFQRVEAVFEQVDPMQLFAECEQASKQASALITPAADRTAGPPLRKKDF